MRFPDPGPAPARSRDFRSVLADVRASCVALYGRGVSAFHPVVVRPSMGFALVPRPAERSAPCDGRGVERWRRHRRLSGCCAAAAAPGLGDGSESDARQSSPRQGLGGLTRHGGRRIEDLCALSRQDARVFGLWTVTLPVEVATALDAVEDGATRWVDTIRRRFGEAHKRACDREGKRRGRRIESAWWFVVEPQKAGRPHLHFVFRSKAQRASKWLLGKGALDRLIKNSFRTVTGTAYPADYAGNVQALRKDPGSYLSKYLRKGDGLNGADVVLRGGWSINLVPRRWWGCSRAARAWVNEYTFTLPDRLVAQLSLRWRRLVGAGLLEASIWEPDQAGAPAVVVGSFGDPGHLRRLLSHLSSLADRSYPGGVVFGRT